VFGGTSSGTSPTNAAPLGRGRVFVVAAAAALLAGIAGAFFTRLKPAPEAATGSTSVTRPAAADTVPTHAASQALVKLELSADPANAELVLDGAKLEGNPFSGQLARDSVMHRLEVRAPGRRSDTRMVHLDQDLTLHVTLPFAAAPAASSSAPAAPPLGSKTSGRPASDDFTHKQREAKPARPIDNSDPYGP
jgi:hypothetical protein